jgi:hypothetical protein
MLSYHNTSIILQQNYFLTSDTFDTLNFTEVRRTLSQLTHMTRKNLQFRTFFGH